MSFGKEYNSWHTEIWKFWVCMFFSQIILLRFYFLYFLVIQYTWVVWVSCLYKYWIQDCAEVSQLNVGETRETGYPQPLINLIVEISIKMLKQYYKLYVETWNKNTN